MPHAMAGRAASSGMVNFANEHRSIYWSSEGRHWGGGAVADGRLPGLKRAVGGYSWWGVGVLWGAALAVPVVKLAAVQALQPWGAFNLVAATPRLGCLARHLTGFTVAVPSAVAYLFRLFGQKRCFQLIEAAVVASLLQLLQKPDLPSRIDKLGGKGAQFHRVVHLPRNGGVGPLK